MIIHGYNLQNSTLTAYIQFTDVFATRELGLEAFALVAAWWWGNEKHHRKCRWWYRQNGFLKVETAELNPKPTPFHVCGLGVMGKPRKMY
jgi:hypothetical protein